MDYDVIIVGSGAGGSAVAYHLTQTGRRVLLLEKGPVLPKDGSTLDVEQVLRQGAFLADEPWLDRHDRLTVPEEHFNLGGKTKWYGAALLRFAPHEFSADPVHQCLGWPITLGELAPFYDEAERLLGVRRFDVEPGFQQLVAGLRRQDPGWRKEQLALGLAADILAYPPEEDRHFDGTASVRGLKADTEQSLLLRVAGRLNLEVLANKLPSPRCCRRRGGRSRSTASSARTAVAFAAAPWFSPPARCTARGCCRATSRAPARGDAALPSYASIGRYYKAHVLTAMLAFSHRSVTACCARRCCSIMSSCRTAPCNPGRQPGRGDRSRAGAALHPGVARLPGATARRRHDPADRGPGSHPDNPHRRPPRRRGTPADRLRRRATSVRAIRTPRTGAHAAPAAAADGVPARRTANSAHRDRACLRNTGAPATTQCPQSSTPTRASTASPTSTSPMEASCRARHVSIRR